MSEHDNIKTPKASSCRRLGLRRSIQRSCPPVSINTRNINLTECSISNNNASTPDRLNANTPLGKTVIPSKSILSTGNNVKYQLSLNSRIREKLTKKRINFLAHTLNEASFTVTEIATSSNESSCTETHEPSASSSIRMRAQQKCTNHFVPKDLLQQNGNSISKQIELFQADIASKKLKIASIHKYDKEITELQNEIKIWKSGLLQALDLLQMKINPPKSKEEILALLHIPADCIK